MYETPSDKNISQCTITRDVILTEPQQLAVVSNVTSVLCYGDNTGTANLQINGGLNF